MTLTTRPIVGIHLDLKGIAFRPRYIPQLMADLAGQKINTILVEYEDVFPFEGIDVADDPAAVFSPATLKRFLAEAADNGIEVVPLQQCLGHLEYLFRWKRYQRYALDRRYPSTLKLASRPGRELVKRMLRQVAQAHPDSRWIHLGMDEARGMDRQSPDGRGDALRIFLDYLAELCDEVERLGKKPLIWTDMLEDHFRPEGYDALRGRVVFMPWDYGTTSHLTPLGRIGGFRTSRQWLQAPEDPQAPAIGPGTRFVEDLPASVRRLVAPMMKGRLFQALPQVDLWTKLGFEVVGATAIRSSSDGPVLPRYNAKRANIEVWAEAIRRNDQRGLIATSWARGTTFCPPNFPIDLAWPLVGDLARRMGLKPAAYWPGLPAATVDRIVRTLGRCRDDWSLEEKIAGEMAELAPRVKEHRYEWDSLRLMAQVLGLRRRADYVLSEVTYFHPDHRPVETEWQRRLNDQAATLKEIASLKEKVRRHFGRRYHGRAFEEWIRDLFDLHVSRLREATRTCRQKRVLARRRYA